MTKRKGLSIPIFNSVSGSVEEFYSERFGVVADDFVSIRPKFEKQENVEICVGELLFYDAKNRGIRFYSFVDGMVRRIVRGDKRKFVAFKFEGEPKVYEFHRDVSTIKLIESNRAEIVDAIIESGLWVSFRQRPYDRVADPDVVPDRIFVMLVDTRPQAPEVKDVFTGSENYFKKGVELLTALTKGYVHVIKQSGIHFEMEHEKVRMVEVTGAHPIGLVGTHINRSFPLNRNRKVWYLDYQDLIAIGKLFVENIVDNRRIVSIYDGRLMRLFNYSSCEGLVEFSGRNRYIAGSVLYGRRLEQEVPYIHRYINILSRIEEVSERRFMGWLRGGFDKFSVKNVFLSKFFPGKIKFNTSLNGSYRPMVPVGSYERVSLFDVPITYFLRALLTKDVEILERLGVLDFGEEDMSPFTFVCVGKYDYALYLREMLDELEAQH
ncbi:MAG: NADH:ubiquinone reductase (Na(+)-transporting) subunit A [Calditerrivibrio sp.]|nr:NADH:ubiquinone reductase (Na(+)-transporting) subunit A [Calditerrivibrio sp.]